MFSFKELRKKLDKKNKSKKKSKNKNKDKDKKSDKNEIVEINKPENNLIEEEIFENKSFDEKKA